MKCVVVEPGTKWSGVRECQPSKIEAPTDLRLQTLEVGICGTDREILAFTHGEPPPDREWWVLGHEALLEVIEPAGASERAEPFVPGDLAVPMVRRPCKREDCPPCRTGRQDFCRTGEFSERGIRYADGFLAEDVVDDERYLIAVPAALRHVAVLTEPLSIAEKALDQVTAIQRRLPWTCSNAESCTALVLGAGAIGLLGAMKLRAQGFKVTVYSNGPSDGPRAGWVRDLGGRYVSAREVDGTGMRKLVGEVDLIYEATGAAGIAFETLERSLAANGVFVFTGIPGRRATAELPVGRLMRDLVLRNQLVVGTVNAGRRHYEDAVGDLALFEARFPGLLARLISRRLPLTEWEAAIVDSREEVKRVVCPQDVR